MFARINDLTYLFDGTGKVDSYANKKKLAIVKWNRTKLFLYFSVGRYNYINQLVKNKIL